MFHLHPPCILPPLSSREQETQPPSLSLFQPAKKMMRLLILAALLSLFITCGIAFRCPELKTPKCTCEVNRSKEFGVISDDKGVIICYGKNVDDIFLNDYSTVIVEANEFCADDAPMDLSEVDITENHLGGDMLSFGRYHDKLRIGEGHRRRLTNRMKDGTLALGNLGQAQCSLQKLVFNHTKITMLNSSYFSNIYLEELRIVNSQLLEHIHPNAFNLSRVSLHTLEMTNLRLSSHEALTFAAAFSMLSKLKLRINMEYINKYTFARFSTLTDLDLSGNKISKIENFSFDQLKNLKTLRLSYNNIHSIPGNMLTFALPSYEFVDVKLNIHLDNNHLSIDMIDPKAFSTFVRPVTLNLSNNNLYTLPEKQFKTFLWLDARNSFEVKNNPIICDSSLDWITDNVLYMNYTIGGLDDEVNTSHRYEQVGDLTFLYPRDERDFSFYKVRGVTCGKNATNLFDKTWYS